MISYTVQAGQKLRISGYCGCEGYEAGDTVLLFPAFAQYFVDRGVIAAT